MSRPKFVWMMRVKASDVLATDYGDATARAEAEIQFLVAR